MGHEVLSFFTPMWPLLRGLPDEERKRVVESARKRSFRRNEVVFHAGDPADTLHLIERGKVAVRVTTPYGEEATFGVLAAGDIFGELALLSPESLRTATITALEPTETLALNRDDFHRIRREHPSVEQFLVKILSDRVIRLSTYLLEALYVPADLRVLRRLLDLGYLYDEAGGVVAIPLTQEDLAGIAGTSRVTVNRILREEEKRGSVELGRAKIRIVDPEAIRARAY